jgi:hypothetical protein
VQKLEANLKTDLRKQKDKYEILMVSRLRDKERKLEETEDNFMKV